MNTGEECAMVRKKNEVQKNVKEKKKNRTPIFQLPNISGPKKWERK